MGNRKRRLKSVADELLLKAREAALAAVQIYNNPTIQFKSELFIVTMNIAWTYLLHSHFRKNRIDYRYAKVVKTRRIFDYTKNGAHKYWELERCLNEASCPLDQGTKNNLRFLIGIRHEIEHQMTKKIDSTLSAKFQATCLNFNSYIKDLFGEKFGIDRHLAFSLQFSAISPTQKNQLLDVNNLPIHIESYVTNFEKSLTIEQYRDMKYAYRVMFVPKTVNKKGQADQVIEFVNSDSEIAKTTNSKYEKVYLKEVDKKKYLAKEIVTLMQADGFKDFTMTQHMKLWQSLDAKNPKKNFAGQLGQQWYWHENWVNEVRKHCEENKYKYKNG